MRSMPQCCLCLGMSLLAMVVLVGCEEQGIRIYEAPKDPPTRQAAAAAPGYETNDPRAPGPLAPGDAHEADAVGRLSWQAPEGWVAASREVPMRLATYYAGGQGEEGLEIAVSAFPGDVGGNLANVNRWREQLGLSPTTEADLDRDAPSFGASGGVHGLTLRIDADVDGQDSMLAAIIHPPGHESTWFVRAQGQPSQLDAHEADVRAFARTFHVDEQGDPPRPAYAQGREDIAGAGGANSQGTTGHTQRELILNEPASWKRLEQSSSIVYASWEFGPEQAPGSVAITPLAGDGGGLFANVNMWRQQLGLPRMGQEDEQPNEPIDVDGREGTLVWVQGEQVSLVAAIVPEEERTWFFRMSGPRELVEQERDTFEEFVSQIRFQEF